MDIGDIKQNYIKEFALQQYFIVANNNPTKTFPLNTSEILISTDLVKYSTPIQLNLNFYHV